MKQLYIVSDQVENATAIKGVSEAHLCRPIGKESVAAAKALGHEARYFDPKKTYDIKSALEWNPDVVILIHVNATGNTKPQGVMGVECGHATRDNEWAHAVIENIAAEIGWSVWGVSTDERLRGFCYYFFRDMREVAYKGRRLVVELGNMQNLEQATFLKNNPERVGAAIARAVSPEGDTMSQEQFDRLMSSLQAQSYRSSITNARAIGDDAKAAKLNTEFYAKWPEGETGLPKDWAPPK